MTISKRARDFPPIAVTKTEAARMVGMEVTSFDKYVLPGVKVIRRGSLVLVPVKELERWTERAADYTVSA